MDLPLAKVLSITIALFIFVSMFNLGLDLTIRQIVEPLRNRRLLANSLAANVVVVPLLALLLTLIFPLDAPTKIGLLLYGCCIGSEAAPKFAQVAGGNTAFAVALLGIFLPITVIGVPFALAQAFPEVHIAQGLLVVKLLFIVALPMGVGLLIRAKRNDLATRLSPLMHRVSSLFLLFVFLLVIYVNYEKFIALQSATLIAGVVFFPLAFAAGYVFGGPEQINRRALGIMTVVRGGSISMLIAGQAFPHDPTVLVIATVMTALSVALVVPGAYLIKRIPI
jgi:BASS family bile acid:Na+ symporter